MSDTLKRLIAEAERIEDDPDATFDADKPAGGDE